MTGIERNKFVVRKSHGKRQLGTCRCRWESNVKIGNINKSVVNVETGSERIRLCYKEWRF
jgi:hypothetical protein